MNNKNILYISAVFLAIIDSIILLDVFAEEKLCLLEEKLNWDIPFICELEKTVEDPATAGWETYRDEELGVEFKYPPDFGGGVIWRPYVWPPKLSVVPSSQYSLKNACPDYHQAPYFPEPQTLNFNGIDFTLYYSAEGAVGSNYLTYCYQTQKGDNYYILDFLIRTTSGCGQGCGPYCGTEHEEECINFNLHEEVEKPIEMIVSTLKFIK